MDCNMPVMNGFQATIELKKLVKNNVLPFANIVAVTANCTIEDINECYECGMDEVITKPIDLDLFDIILKNYKLV